MIAKRLVLAGLVLVMGVWANAGSIYAKKSQESKRMFADNKANQIGDVLTIVINEAHKVDSKTSRDLEKSTSTELSLDGSNIKIQPVVPALPTVGINTSSNKSLNGSSDYKDERKIEDRITVVVQDIHPNGNLVVIGSVSRDVDGDKQTISVSGIVRPTDISFDNTIRSEQVANFTLVSKSEGPTKNYNNPGWLGKILDAIWPF